MASLVSAVTTVPPELLHLTVSKPAEELPGTISAAGIRDTTELYMGHKSIDQLWGFDRFVNLEVLWLNNNNVSAGTRMDCRSAMTGLPRAACRVHVSCVGNPPPPYLSTSCSFPALMHLMPVFG